MNLHFRPRGHGCCQGLGTLMHSYSSVRKEEVEYRTELNQERALPRANHFPKGVFILLHLLFEFVQLKVKANCKLNS